MTTDVEAVGCHRSDARLPETAGPVTAEQVTAEPDASPGRRPCIMARGSTRQADRMTKEHPQPMASAHPGRRTDGTEPKRQGEDENRSIDHALQDLYAAYGNQTSPPKEMMDLAREAAAALVGNPAYDKITPTDTSGEPSPSGDPEPGGTPGGCKARSDEHTS